MGTYVTMEFPLTGQFTSTFLWMESALGVARSKTVITVKRKLPKHFAMGLTHLKWSPLHKTPLTHLLFCFLARHGLNSVSIPKSDEFFLLPHL